MPPKEPRSYHAQAVVLRHIEYGEADRILTIYTLERGKMQVLVRGVRRIRSRKAGHLEPFTQVSLYLAKGRNLDIVTQAEAIQTFDGIRADLKLTAYAAYVVELLDRFTYAESDNRQLFKLLVDTLSRLQSSAPAPTVVHAYELRLMDALGFRPELTVCVHCGKKIEPVDQYFSARLGGALCPDCSAADPAAWRVSVDVLKYLRHLQRSPWQQLQALAIPAEVEADLKRLSERYLTYLLENGLRTPGFLDAIS